MWGVATLTITRGLPGSGKTTWARERPAARVNRDDLRLMLHGAAGYQGWAERQVTVAEHAQIEALLRAGVDVVCDDTNLRHRTVRDLHDLAVRAGATFAVHDLTEVPLEVCLARDAARTDRPPVGAAVIRDMHRRYLAGRRLPLPGPAPDPGGYPLYVPPPDAPQAVLVDIDGTVALMGGRSPYDESRVDQDAPHEPVIAAVRAMHAAGYRVVYCTGRSDACRAQTAAWLDRHVGVPYEALHMRRSGDGRRDAVVKAEIFDKHVRHAYRVLGVFDDRAQVVRMWRALGLTVFQVDDGNF